MKFIFEWKKYFTGERSEYYNYTDKSVLKITLILQCPKQRNDFSDIFTSEDMENISLVFWM